MKIKHVKKNCVYHKVNSGGFHSLIAGIYHHFIIIIVHYNPYFINYNKYLALKLIYSYTHSAECSWSELNLDVY